MNPENQEVEVRGSPEIPFRNKALIFLTNEIHYNDKKTVLEDELVRLLDKFTINYIIEEPQVTFISFPHDSQTFTCATGGRVYMYVVMTLVL